MLKIIQVRDFSRKFCVFLVVRHESFDGVGSIPSALYLLQTLAVFFFLIFLLFFQI
jgi:hypothetical protein